MTLMIKPEGYDLRSTNGGKCWICCRGDTVVNGRKEPVLWTGIHIEWEGNADICFDCARQIGEAVGMIERTAYEELAVLFKDALGELERAEMAIADKEDAVRLLSSELVGAATRGVYGTIPLREVDIEPDFAESLAEREQTYSVDG